MRFTILTLFPEYFESPLSSSILGRARSAGLLTIDFLNLREFGEGKYRAVDDKPYGGGAGMVMMPTVLERALLKLLGSEERVDALEKSVRALREASVSASDHAPVELVDAKGESLPLVVYLSPQGKRLTAARARALASPAAGKHLVLLCGHYEGIDERALEAFVHEEVSIGDYILTGGEPAAVVLLDAVSRFIPGVVGEAASVTGDTFEAVSPEMSPGGLKYPVFTRPPVFRGREIPPVLTSGHHGEVAKWRRKESGARTLARRPDLYVPEPEPKAKKKRRQKP